MTEDQLEQETLAWLQDVGYIHLYGPDVALGGADYCRALQPFSRARPSRR